MIWLEKEIIIDTISIDIAVLIFSILSLFCSVITIVIYKRVKSLRTIIYKLFFQIAINETISRLAHIFEFINVYLIKNRYIFDINIILIYLTDTAILIFLSFSCYAMFELILKQNKNINNRFPTIVKIILIFSVIMTIIFFLVSINEANEGRDIDLYRNIIALHFIKDTDKEGQRLIPILITIILYVILVVYSIYKVILIQLFIYKRGDISDGDEDDNLKEKKKEKMQKSLKLKSFRNKLFQYPVLGLYFIFPLIIYSFIEYFKDIDEQQDLVYLKKRYIFYNIYCFMNSTRGWMFFRVFISNEKIKIFLFKNYLKSSIFYTIDKTYLKRERRFTNDSKGTLSSSISSLLSYGNNKRINSVDFGKSEDEEKILELNNQDNNEDNLNDETKNLNSKSEALGIKNLDEKE